MKRFAVINGVVLAPENAVVSAYDRGFLYGDSVFETLRTYNGAAFALREHAQRLAQSAARVHLRLPLTEGELVREVHRALALADNDESYVRVMITRGEGPMGLDLDLAGQPSWFLLVEPLQCPSPELYGKGAAAVLVRTRRDADDTEAAGAKLGNYLVSILAVREAKARQAHEALIENARGELLEGATSNVFVVRRGQLVTPPIDAGILPGITRACVLRAARALGIPYEERVLLAADWEGADEMFITSSIREVLPIVRLNDKSIGNGRPGATTRSLHCAFREQAGAKGPHPWERGGAP